MVKKRNTGKWQEYIYIPLHQAAVYPYRQKQDRQWTINRLFQNFHQLPTPYYYEDGDNKNGTKSLNFESTETSNPQSLTRVSQWRSNIIPFSYTYIEAERRSCWGRRPPCPRPRVECDAIGSKQLENLSWAYNFWATHTDKFRTNNFC